MKRSVTWILGAVLLATTASPRSTAGDLLYVLTSAEEGLTAETTLGTIDTGTGIFSSIVSVGTGAGNLAKHGDYLYFTLGVGTSTVLNRFSLLSGTIDTDFYPTITGGDPPIPNQAIMGMTYGGDALGGKFYALVQNNPLGTKVNTFGTIEIATNPSPGSATWNQINSDIGISETLPPTGGRLANHNGTIYAALYGDGSGGSYFASINSTTGEISAAISENNLYRYMNLASGGSTLYGIFGNQDLDPLFNGQRLYTINPENGNLSLEKSISGDGLGTYFHGAAFVPVPEPSTYALGMIAAVTAGWAMRRKKNRS